MNTVPTVVRLTNKLQKQELPAADVADGSAYPFCPLCLGVRDQINNLLEIGSTISSIEISEATFEVKPSFITDLHDKPIAIKSTDEWFPEKLTQVVCFGCKRMCISAKNRNKLLDIIPDVVKINAELIWQQENQSS